MTTEPARPSGSLKIEHAKYILTVDPQRRVITDGSILIEGQRIARVGKAAELASLPTDRVLDASEMVVIPSMTDGHIHVSYAHAVRGIFPDDIENRLAYVFQMQSAMTAEEEHATSLLAITELLKGGTTSFIDPGSTKHPDACLQAYADSGCRITIGEHVTDQANPLNLPVYSTAEAIARMEGTIKTYDGRLDGRLRAWAMLFSMGFATDELLVAAKGLADTYGTGLTLHHFGSRQGRAAVPERAGTTPTEHLQHLGILGPNVLLSHAMGLEDAEVDCLARTDTSVVVCPGAMVKGGSGLSQNGRLPDLVERGVDVALGTDSANSTNYLDMVRTMGLAAVVYKDGRQDTHLVPAETAVELATITGARACGLGDELGSIEAGKRADLVLFDTKRPEWRGPHRPCQQPGLQRRQQERRHGPRRRPDRRRERSGPLRRRVATDPAGRGDRRGRPGAHRRLVPAAVAARLRPTVSLT